MSMTLVLCRTPFQAKIALEIIHDTEIFEYDLVYFTYHDTARDRHYFNRLKGRARHAHYINALRRKKDAIHHFRIWRALPSTIKHESYACVMLASIDSYLFRIMFSRSPDARLVTFDDGTANISLDSSYHRFEPSRLAALYDFVFGCPSVSKMKEKISAHFSVYPGYENIVRDSILRFIDPWKRDVCEGDVGLLPGPKFFVGSPFEEVISSGMIGPDGPAKIVEYCRSQEIDYYITHPRETSPLDIGRQRLASEHLLAEELILSESAGFKPVVYASFSTVLFNLSPDHVDKVYLSVGDEVGEGERVELVKKAGCKVVRL